MANRQVLMNEQPLRNKLTRFIEKKIQRWIEEKRILDSQAQDVAFTVTFNEDGAKNVSCVTEIQVRGCVWRGCELATDTQSAFIHSLKRLQPH